MRIEPAVDLSPPVAADPARQERPADAPPWTQARIAVVDDEPLSSAALEAFLRSLGCTRVTTIAPEGSAADALRGFGADLVVLELVPGQPAGLQLLAHLRGDPLLRHVPVLAVSAQDDRATRLSALELGCIDYLVKPIDAADLELRLRNAVLTKLQHDRLAHTDGLTGLPNRESSLDRLDWAVKLARRQNLPGAVLQVGLDRFKHVTDALGPAVGDELLRAVGQRLVACVRDTDVVARDTAPESAALVGRSDGDEFTVLLPAMALSDHAGVIANRIVLAMADPFMLVGQELFVTCQVGISVFPTDARDADSALRQARLAMRHARTAGGGSGSGFRFYSQELHGRSANRLTLERELHHALERDELLLYYQPKVSLASGRIAGAEALVRWQHPQRGLLDPGAFITVAEETGLIVPLGEWALREAMRQLAAWRRQGLPDFTVAVNVSSLQLRRPHLDRTVLDALASAGLGGAGLCLELTESAIMETGTAVNGTLLAIKEMGVRLSLDDFGTGYSSLSYLRHLPIDELKIDRSFVAEFDVAGDSAAVITRAVIAMAQGLGLRVVAEGVETQSQLAFLRANGCDECQGFLFSRPLPASAFQALDWQADLGLRPGAVPTLDSGALPRTGAAASVDDGSSRVLSLAG